MHFVHKEAPEFEVCSHNQTLDTKQGQAFAVAVWQDPSATDNSGDVSEVTCVPHSGSEFSIGLTLVTCEAVDGSGNNNTCNFEIGVEGKKTYLDKNNQPFLAYFVVVVIVPQSSLWYGKILLKRIFMRNRSLSNAWWLYGKKQKIGKGNLYLTKNRLGINEIWCAQDNHSYTYVSRRCERIFRFEL